MIRVLATLGGIGNGLLMNPMTEATLEGLRTGVHAPKQKDRPAKAEAEEKLYTDDEGNLGIPMENLFSCLVEAGRYVKVNKKQVSTASSTILPAFLTIEDTFLAFTEYSDWEVDKRRGVNPNGGEATCLVRPKFKEWQCQVTLEIDEKIASEGTVQDLLSIAGSRIGLGDFRPAKRGPFGRFAVTAWKVLERDTKVEEKATAGNGKGSKAKAEEAVAATAS
ncbi:hypothetical protein EXS54_00285 [Patescibacteria group bacterium]|nr:hypothetical protein [Patescibacteria group bacterium]